MSKQASPLQRICLLAFLLFVPPRLGAATFALLIGVGEYPSLPSHLQLQGPVNDVKALQRLLASRSVPARNLHVLAKAKSASRAPTRANIMQALTEMTQRLAPGDQAILYFAGHGAQQPSSRQEEPDGLDEIFLPQDIGLWDGGAGHVTNAITDNELGEALRAMGARGASVWAIFDTCHAGSMIRSPSSGSSVRGLNPVQLGIPPAAQRLTIGPALLPIPGVVAFFAAGPDERAPEQALPDNPNLVRGLFSYWLEHGLRSQPRASYAQLMAGIRQRYQDAGRLQPNPHLLASDEEATKQALSGP